MATRLEIAHCECRSAAMPELPDVEIFRQYMAATVLHKKVVSVDECHGDLLHGVSRKRLSGFLLRRQFTSCPGMANIFLPLLATLDFWFSISG